MTTTKGKGFVGTEVPLYVKAALAKLARERSTPRHVYSEAEILREALTAYLLSNNFSPLQKAAYNESGESDRNEEADSATNEQGGSV